MPNFFELPSRIYLNEKPFKWKEDKFEYCVKCARMWLFSDEYVSHIRTDFSNLSLHRIIRLRKKRILTYFTQRNLCSRYSISTSNEFYVNCLTILNRIKLERTVIFIKYIAIVILLVFPPKILIWNTVVLPAPNLLKVLELVENEIEKTSSESI